MEFEVDNEGNTLPIITREGKDLIIQVPPFTLIAKNEKDGIGNIQ